MIPEQPWQRSGHPGKMKGPTQLLRPSSQGLGLIISNYAAPGSLTPLKDFLQTGCVTPLTECHLHWVYTAPPAQENRFSPPALLLQPKKMGVLLCIPMHAFVLFSPWKVSVAMGQLCFLTRQRKGSGTQQVIPTRKPNCFLPALQSHCNQGARFCTACRGDTE